MIHLDAVVVGDGAAAWADAGFNVSSGTVSIGSSAIVCRGDDRPPGWTLWSDDADVPSSVDGIPTDRVAAMRSTTDVRHPNHVIELDHLVLRSPDLDRTTGAFADLGVECRRIREIPGSDPAAQQRFFRLGPTIVELVGLAEPTGDGPATMWGFAFTTADLDGAVARLGPACSAPKDAVQPGRRIATVRTRDLGISSPMALMTPDPRHR